MSTGRVARIVALLMALAATATQAGVVYLDDLTALQAVVDEGDTVVLRSTLRVAASYPDDRFYSGSYTVESGDGQGAGGGVPGGATAVTVERAFTYADEGSFVARVQASATTVGTYTYPVYGWIPYTYYTQEYVCDFYFIVCIFGHYESVRHTGYNWGQTGVGFDNRYESSSAATATSVLVRNVAPQILGLTGNLTVDAGESFGYAAYGYDRGVRDVLSYLWDLDGDGVYGDASGASGSAAFQGAGAHRVGLMLTDGDGGIAFGAFEVTVRPGTPVDVPEPATLLLMAGAGIAAGARLRRRDGTSA